MSHHRARETPFVIAWSQDVGPHDDSESCRAAYATQSEAEFALELIQRDPANQAIRTSWQDEALLAELVAIPF